MTTIPTNSSTTANGVSKVPLHKKFSRQVTKSKPKPKPNFEQQALAIVSAGAGEVETLAALLKLAIGIANGIGGFIATRTEEQWYHSKQKPAIGKIPSGAFFDEAFSPVSYTHLTLPTILLV